MKLSTLAMFVSLSLFVPSCGNEQPGTTPTGAGAGTTPTATEGAAEEAADHAHDEVDIGTARIGEHDVACAQGHGAVEAGKEGHLVVKLPYNDAGATVVRVWLGTQERTASTVTRAEYAPSHDDYDAHVMAPDPLPAGTRWWIELEKPDGTKSVGSIAPQDS